MADPYLGEVRMFGGNYAPVGWRLCDGALLSIAENDALYALLGTTYGGDGSTTFGLPDLRGRVPLHQGAGPGVTPRVLGEKGGTERATLSAPQLPAHRHSLFATTGAAQPDGNPSGLLATPTGSQLYGPGPANLSLASTAVSATGVNNNSHDNVAPYQAVTFIICVEGVFPPPPN